MCKLGYYFTYYLFLFLFPIIISYPKTYISKLAMLKWINTTKCLVLGLDLAGQWEGCWLQFLHICKQGACHMWYFHNQRVVWWLRVVATVKQEEEGDEWKPEPVPSFTAQHAASAAVNSFLHAHSIGKYDYRKIFNLELAVSSET